MPAKKIKTSEEPETLQEAMVYFADKAKALQFFVDLRWPEGVVCPYCEGKKLSFIKTRQTWACATCKQVLAQGRDPSKTRLSGPEVARRIWLITNARTASAATNWSRARRHAEDRVVHAAPHSPRDAEQDGGKLAGQVEVDETYIGGKARNMHASEAEAHRHHAAPLDDRQGCRHGPVGASRRRTAQPGCAPKSSPAARRHQLQAIVRKHVERGATSPHRRAQVLRPAETRTTSTTSSTTPRAYVDGKSTRTAARTSGPC